MTTGIETTGSVPEFDLADRMRKSLRHADLGVQGMADYLDVTRGTVGNWINGRIHPSTQTLRLWALRTGVPFKWLETGKTPTGNNPDGGGTVRHEGIEPPTRWYVETPRIRGADVIPLRPTDTRELVAA